MFKYKGLIFFCEHNIAEFIVQFYQYQTLFCQKPAEFMSGVDAFVYECLV